MISEKMVVGAMKANCYIIGSEGKGEAVLVDPGDDPEAILARINELGLKVKYIINTHGHPDHIGANKALKEATGAPILIHEGDAARLTMKDDR
jgi:glyoxylase-like metal-dependent hydrolase (beta-lactamase superfamily II)